MAGRVRAVLALICLGTSAASAPITAYSFAGHFTAPFDNRTEDGRRFTSTDTVLIVPTDSRHAMIDIHTHFLNDSECRIGGVATVDRDTLVFRNPNEVGYEGRSCELRIQRSGNRLTWDDRGSCQSYCGIRGRLSDGVMAWSSRRPVTASQRARLQRDLERNRNGR